MSPGKIFKHFNDKCKAAVQLLVTKQYGISVYSESAFSKASVAGPNGAI